MKNLNKKVHLLENDRIDKMLLIIEKQAALGCVIVASNEHYMKLFSLRMHDYCYNQAKDLLRFSLNQ